MTPSADLPKNWVVYLLRCADNSLYCGISNNLSKRIKQHNGELKGGAKYTKSRMPCELVFSQNMADKSNALKREITIKKLSRTQKLTLIKRHL